MKEELAELQRLVAKLDPPWNGKRPPYGETDPKFDLEAARAVLKRLEYNPHTDDSDTLFVELRMACDWIEEHKPIIDVARAVAQTLPPQGWVDPYPCDCSGTPGICWIVRHPSLSPPVSYPTKEEAEEALEKILALSSPYICLDS